MLHLPFVADGILAQSPAHAGPKTETCRYGLARSSTLPWTYAPATVQKRGWRRSEHRQHLVAPLFPQRDFWTISRNGPPRTEQVRPTAG